MFPLLYGGSLCVIGGLALVVVAWVTRAQQRNHDMKLRAVESGFAVEISAHAQTITEWRDRYKHLSARCKELERELTEIKLGTATAGYTFEQVPARTVPARVRMVKAR